MRNLTFFKDDGTEQRPAAADVSTGIVTLAAGTYYAELEVSRVEKAGLTSVQWGWGATLAAVISYEGTNFPEISSSASAASGWEPTVAPTLTIVAGVADNDIARWVNQADGRQRAKIVVSVAGTLRGADNHKAG